MMPVGISDYDKMGNYSLYPSDEIKKPGMNLPRKSVKPVKNVNIRTAQTKMCLINLPPISPRRQPVPLYAPMKGNMFPMPTPRQPKITEK